MTRRGRAPVARARHRARAAMLERLARPASTATSSSRSTRGRATSAVERRVQILAERCVHAAPPGVGSRRGPSRKASGGRERAHTQTRPPHSAEKGRQPATGRSPARRARSSRRRLRRASSIRPTARGAAVGSGSRHHYFGRQERFHRGRPGCFSRGHGHSGPAAVGSS